MLLGSGYPRREGGRKSRIVLERDAMNLPEIEMIGLRAAERLFQHLEGERFTPPEGAYLGLERADGLNTDIQAIGPLYAKHAKINY